MRKIKKIFSEDYNSELENRIDSINNQQENIRNQGQNRSGERESKERDRIGLKTSVLLANYFDLIPSLA